jgi:hypothetical protein
MSNIFNYKINDVSTINYTKPEKKGKKFLLSYSYNDTPQLLVKTPKLVALEDFVILENSRAYLKVSVEDNDFFSFFSDIDDQNVTVLHQASEEVFGKKYPLDIVDGFYHDTMKVGKELSSYPYITLNVPISDNEVEMQVYDSDKKLIDPSSIKKGTEFKAMISLEGILFTREFFYNPIEVIQIKLCKQKVVEEKPEEICMISSDEEEINNDNENYEDLVNDED